MADARYDIRQKKKKKRKRKRGAIQNGDKVSHSMPIKKHPRPLPVGPLELSVHLRTPLTAFLDKRPT